jgi:uncharacterized integral membrane protein
MTDTSPSTAGSPRPTSSSGSLGRTGKASRHPTAPTRVSGAWVTVIIAAFILVLLLVFILQNTQSVEVSYFTASGTMPLGVALLLAAIGGLLLTAAVASLRIWQLRHRLGASKRPAGQSRSTRPL